MSIKLMAAAWELNIPASEKMVLLCLCDHSNDAGVCWPSISTIARKCSRGERTVQAAIQWLRKNGYCTWDEKPGRPHKFMLNPRSICTPAVFAPPQSTTEPPQPLHPTPAATAPEPSITIKEPSNIIKRSRKVIDKPDCVSDSLWSDWLAHRDGKFTQTALDGFEREAAKAGWTLTQAFTEAIERKWQGFKADWVKDKTNGNSGRISNNTAGNGFRAGLRQVQTGYIDEPWGNNSSRM